MNEAAQPAPARKEGQHCPRCLQAVAPKTPRCPNCGTPIKKSRNLMLWIGTGGLCTLFFAILLMWLVVYNEDLEKAPLSADDQQQEILPDTSKSADKKPAEPEKPPPLNK